MEPGVNFSKTLRNPFIVSISINIGKIRLMAWDLLSTHVIQSHQAIDGVLK
jgi:hypothetical protein